MLLATEKRFKYPGSRGFIGRASFKTLKDTTLKTFFEVAKMQGIVRGKHFDLTGPWDKENPNCLLFGNGSMIYLRDLATYPSDPDFDELGSLEITDAFIDECGQISQKAKDTLKTRIRYGLNQWDLTPKILYSTNPVKSWPYTEFYRPSRDGTIPSYRKFVQAFVTDNPHAPKSYIQLLQRLPEGPQKERLLKGNWEYDDDPAALIIYDRILDCFTNDFEKLKGKRCITADVARYGSDITVIGVWDGFRVTIYWYKGLSVPEVAEKIRGFQQQHGIPNSRTVVDDDGVGGGVVDIVGCIGFVNNSRPWPNPVKPDLDEKGNPKPENYDNLKSQCSYRMAQRVNDGGLFIENATPEMKEKITEEMEQVKQKDVDTDGKKGVLPKKIIKELIGRSTDYWDMLMMRELLELKPVKKAGAILL